MDVNSKDFGLLHGVLLREVRRNILKTERATQMDGSLLHIRLVRGILELLLGVVPICGQHAQVAAIAPLSVLASGSEELGSLLWVLLSHRSEM